MISIPFYQESSSKFTYEIDLDGDGVFTLSFFWNTRLEQWEMSIIKNDVILIAGIFLTSNYALLKQYRGMTDLPRGEFVVVDSEEKGYGITFDNIGTTQRFIMYYLNEEEYYGL